MVLCIEKEYITYEIDNSWQSCAKFPVTLPTPPSQHKKTCSRNLARQTQWQNCRPAEWHDSNQPSLKVFIDQHFCSSSRLKLDIQSTDLGSQIYKSYRKTMHFLFKMLPPPKPTQRIRSSRCPLGDQLLVWDDEVQPSKVVASYLSEPTP